MLPFLKNQPRLAQLRQVERQRAVRHAQLLGDYACSKAAFASLYHHTEQCEAMLLCKSA